MAKVVPKRKELWHPIPFSPDAAYALQAMVKGEAVEHQQKLIVDWLIREACQTYEETFVPDNARVTDYVAGRRSVGLAIVKHLSISPAKLKVETSG